MSRCPSLGALRSMVDGALEGIPANKIAAHVSGCARCASRIALLKQDASRVEQHWRSLGGGESPESGAAANRAIAAFRARYETGGSRMSPSTRRTLRPVLGGLVATALLVTLFAFAPARAFARQMLGVFRVDRFAVVEVRPDQATMEQISEQLLNRTFVAEPQALQEPTETRVSGLEEACALAGFAVRAPATWPEGGVAPEYTVVGPASYSVRVSGDGLRAALAMADMDPAAVPAELTEAEVLIEMQSAVHIKGMYTEIVQVYRPEVRYPEAIDPSVLGEAGLRLLGLSPAQARRISRSIDWTTTVVLPIPTNLASFREVEVAGGTGVLLRAVDDAGQAPDTLIMLWEKDDVVYLISARMGSEALASLAASLF